MCLEVKLIEIAYSFWKSNSPKNTELFHVTRMPPEAPFEGRNMKLSNARVQKFLIYKASKSFLFVSCRQHMSELLSEILSLIEFHFVLELILLTFQHRIF